MMRRLLVALAMVGLLVVPAAPAVAYEPVNIVHTEKVQAGPYELTVGFSTWPLHALQSLDFTFIPEGGIAGKSGTLTTIGPDGDEDDDPLARHPRKRDVWGLDVRSLEQQGSYTFRFAIDGPRGHGVGELRGLTVLEQPGPPLGLSWAISTLPLWALVVIIVVAWHRVRPSRLPETWQPG